MAFSNLFSNLPAVEEGVRSPGQPARHHSRNQTGGQRGNSQKRKPQFEQTGPYNKKQRYQAQPTSRDHPTSFRDDDFGFTQEKLMHNHSDDAGNNNMRHKGQNYQNRKSNKQHQQKDGWRPANRGGRHQTGPNWEKSGGYSKNRNDEQKQRYQAQPTSRDHPTSFRDDDFGFTQEKLMRNHSDDAGNNNMRHKGQNYQNRKSNKQHQQKDGWRPANRGGRHQTGPNWEKNGGYSRNRNDEQDVQVKSSRFMTQEFKDQNTLLMDGQLACRYFVFGRCIKGDDCQLKHMEGYNDVIKEPCKFYIQGFCTKGKSCPYMHKSFPCKFFHDKGKCHQGADCRFSHEPLNDVTNRLLGEAIKRDQDLNELKRKAEEKESGAPESTEESETVEANRIPDTQLQPFWPSLYNSEETNAEKETLVYQTDDLTEEAVPPHASDAAQPHSPMSTNLKQEEPVCYSVAAVLGPQRFKPFPTFYTTPGGEESATSGSADQIQAPYSVDAVLRSYKSVENSTCGRTPVPPTAQTVSYILETDSKESTDSLLSSETRDKKFFYSTNTRNEEKSSQDNMSKSLQMHTSLISKTCSGPPVASRDYKKQCSNMPESLKPAQIAAHEVHLELLHCPDIDEEKSSNSKGNIYLPPDITCSVNSKIEGVIPFGNRSISSRPAPQTSRRLPQLIPHPYVLTSDSRASMKPFYPSSGFTEFKSLKPAVEPVTSSIKTSDSADSVSCQVAAPGIHLRSKKTQAGLKHGTQQHLLTETDAECSSKTPRCGDLAAGSKKTQKSPFYSLFSSPITDSLQPEDDSVTDSSCPQGIVQSTCSPLSADYRSNLVKRVVEPDKTSTRSFLSLFAAPLPAMQPKPDNSRTSSCSQLSNQSLKNTSQVSSSKQRASNLETPLSDQVRTDFKEIPHDPRSPDLSPNPEIGNEDDSMDHVNQPSEQLMNPVCSLVSDSNSNSPSATRQPSEISPCKGSAVAAAGKSVLKTLFLSLGPYQKDGEQQDIGSDQPPSSVATGPVAVSHSTEHRPSLQTPHVSLSSPGVTETQVRNCGRHNMPFKPVMQLMQRHTRPRQKPPSEEGRCVNGEVVATPFKDLFKTLDTTVFHRH